MLRRKSTTESAVMAYHQENKYCKHIGSAKIEIYKALHINKKRLYELLSIP